MKKTINIILVFFCLASVSCKKDIPSDKTNYIGTWECISCDADETKSIVINNNGTGKYESLKPGSTMQMGGNVKFDGNDFRIGGAVIKKKFTTNVYPKKEVITLKPYAYKWLATFNGDEYKKAN